MAKHTLYYATNRAHSIDKDSNATRFRPDGYGGSFSSDGHENLRFGRLSVEAEAATVAKLLQKTIKGGRGSGDGEKLSEYLAKQAKDAKIRAYREKAPSSNKNAVLGSKAMFADLKADMDGGADVVVYIHGFNVSWAEAVGSALALQAVLNHKGATPVVVVLFSWPSDGKMIPYASYRSDRSDAEASGKPVGRAFLKLRDFLFKLGRNESELCDQDIHLLCHSMGNFVLQSALAHMQKFNKGQPLPRMFEQMFLCAADVDDDALEPGEPLERAHQMCRNLSVYHNKSDKALVISDYSKGQPERLGGDGVARPRHLHKKVHQVDCHPVAQGLVEHSYYLIGKVADDIRASVDGLAPEAGERPRLVRGSLDNVWIIHTGEQ